MRHVVVAGGGASGTLLAAGLLRLARRPLRVTVVDPSPRLGRGRAYAEGSAELLLNVRASGMSAWPDDPGHFARWLSARRPGLRAPEDAFAPRPLYGDYLEEVIDECRRSAATGVDLVHVRDTVVDAEYGEEDVRCVLASGRRLESGRLAIATGNAPSRPPLSPPDGASWTWADPLDPDALEGLPFDAPIAVAGTALTLVDLIARLDARGYRGVVHAVSRHGLLPRAHADAPRRVEPAPWWALPRTARGLTSVARRLAELQPREDGTRAVESFRTVTDELWRELPDPERRRFLRHVLPLWNVHRHRMPPETARVVAAWLREGRLRVLAGRIVAVEPGAGGGPLRLAIRPRGKVEIIRLEARRLFDATGPGDPLGERLQAALVARGLALAHPSGLGLDVGPDGCLVSNASTPGVAALGPVSRGAALETTAIPEIRVQAARLAGSWAGRLC